MTSKRAKSKLRLVTCVCGTLFFTSHSQGKYCSPNCKRVSLRALWRKYSFKNRKRKYAYRKVYYELNKDRMLSQAQAYRQTTAGKRAIATSKKHSHIAHPERGRAATLVFRALKSGRLTKQSCYFCGSLHAQAHHPDYTDPLRVTWLCPRCHRAWHKILNQIKSDIRLMKGENNGKERAD